MPFEKSAEALDVEEIRQFCHFLRLIFESPPHILKMARRRTNEQFGVLASTNPERFGFDRAEPKPRHRRGPKSPVPPDGSKVWASPFGTGAAGSAESPISPGFAPSRSPSRKACGGVRCVLRLARRRTLRPVRVGSPFEQSKGNVHWPIDRLRVDKSGGDSDLPRRYPLRQKTSRRYLFCQEKQCAPVVPLLLWGTRRGNGSAKSLINKG